jgi:hypothetical protein
VTGASHPARVPGLALPAGWHVRKASGHAGFITHALLERPDGSLSEWSSRRHRKGLGLRSDSTRARGRWFRGASATSWRIGVLFMIGSTCFALGSMPLYFDNIDPAVVAWTFFVGSIFFTTASYLQYHEASSAPTGPDDDAELPPRLRRILSWAPHRIDWWACAVQLVGTLFFNLTTFAGTRADLDFTHEKRLVWAPDVIGSICFLVASWLACLEIWDDPAERRSIGWWIAWLNMVGSIAFGFAAVAARYVDTSGEVANIAVVNLGTFVGAVCFFAGALLLPVESARESSAAAVGEAPTAP